MTRMQAGAFDVPITIEKRNTVQKNDWTGEQEFIDWDRHEMVWTRRQVLRGSERFAAQQFSARVDVVYHLRHKVDGITHAMRVNDGGEIYDITGIVPPERAGGGQELHCFRHAD